MISRSNAKHRLIDKNMHQKHTKGIYTILYTNNYNNNKKQCIVGNNLLKIASS